MFILLVPLHSFNSFLLHYLGPDCLLNVVCLACIGIGQRLQSFMPPKKVIHSCICKRRDYQNYP